MLLNPKFAYAAAPFRANFGFRRTLETYYARVVWFRRFLEDARNSRNLLNHHAGSYGHFFAAVERLGRTFLCLLVLAIGGSTFFTAAAHAQNAPLKLVVLGDSLSAGLGLPAADAFPAKLEKALKDKGINVAISNAGVSGDTTSGGLDRLGWSVPDGTQGVILELGANDALRGTDPKVTRAALDEILKRLKARHIAVLLCGMVAPPNYGAEYAAQFNAIYPDLAKTYDVPLYPFFLDGVAADTKLNQADGMHPTAAGVAVIVNNVLPLVESFVHGLAAEKE
ncbi:MAG: arylesterase [Proteobacteria bacterium]|nr:arylesterase [Pseudomonadota bacterium]